MKTEQALRDILGRNVRSRRESRDWSQEILAEKTGVSKNTISEIETGQKFARANTLVQLAIALDTQVYELFKPHDIQPDNNRDFILKYGQDIREAVDKLESQYLMEEK